MMEHPSQARVGGAFKRTCSRLAMRCSMKVSFVGKIKDLIRWGRGWVSPSA